MHRSGGKARTCDQWVMNPMNYQLFYPASIARRVASVSAKALSYHFIERRCKITTRERLPQNDLYFFYFSFFSWKIKIYILHFHLYILCAPNKKEKIKKPRPTSGRGKTIKNALMLVDDFGRWLRNFLQGQRHDILAPRGIRPNIRQTTPQESRRRLQRKEILNRGGDFHCDAS